MKLAILIGRFPPGAVGGAELQAEGWARRLSDRHRVTVITRHDAPASRGATYEQRDGFTLIRLPVARTRAWRTALDLARIERTVAGLDPRPDVLLCFQTFISGLAGVRLTRRLGIPAVVWVRGEQEYRLARSPLDARISPWVWRRAAAVLVQTGAGRAALLEALGRVDAPLAARLQIDVVPNGLTLPAAATSPPPGGPLLAVGRLIPDKGMDVLIEAAAGLGRRVVIAGDGPERARLEAQARAAGADVVFEGIVPHARLATLLDGALAAVLVSRRGEGLPNALLEAMAHARPVIATPVAGVAELVRDGLEGWLVPPGDVAALRARMQQAIADPALAARLGAAARERVAPFAWERVRPALEAVLERVAAGARHRQLPGRTVPVAVRHASEQARGAVHDGAVRSDAPIHGAAPDPHGTRGRICMFAPYLWPVASGARGFAGGAEVQQWMLARGLVARGFDVTVVSCDFGQPARSTLEGVTFLRAFRIGAGPPVLRFLHPRLTRAVAALREARADVYFVQGAGFEAGLAADVARLMGAGFVFLAAHEFDARPDLPALPYGRDRAWYRRALRHADAVLAQTGTQQAMFRDNFRVTADVLPNPHPLPAHPVDAGAGDGVLWIATFKASKRPEWFLELARRLPSHRFRMCGIVPPPPLGHEHWDAAQRAARAHPHLELIGEAVRGRLDEIYRDAAVFVHTSPAEGFPYAVLEAWSYGVPTVTAFDPDGVSRRFDLGAVVDDLPGLIAAVEALLADPARRRACGERARAYVAAHHDPGRVYDALAATLDRVVARVRPRRGGVAAGEGSAR